MSTAFEVLRFLFTKINHRVLIRKVLGNDRTRNRTHTMIDRRELRPGPLPEQSCIALEDSIPEPLPEQLCFALEAFHQPYIFQLRYVRSMDSLLVIMTIVAVHTETDIVYDKTRVLSCSYSKLLCLVYFLISENGS